MQFMKFVSVVVLLSAVAVAAEDDSVPLEPLKKEARSDLDSENSILLPADSAAAANNLEEMYDAMQVKASAVGPTYLSQPVNTNFVALNPVYSPQAHILPQNLGFEVKSYQPQAQPDFLGRDKLVTEEKEEKEQEEVSLAAKELQPEYFPKDSSYATVPRQPDDDADTPRFVADPSKQKFIATLSPEETLQFTQPQAGVSLPYPYLMPVAHNVFPAHPNAVINPGFVNPGAPYFKKMDTATVKYEKSNKGFMDRMWGEVMTVRQAITQDFFGAIPAFFRNIWDSIVGVFSSASSRMLGDFDWRETTSRMWRNIDWVEILNFVSKQLS